MRLSGVRGYLIVCMVLGGAGVAFLASNVDGPRLQDSPQGEDVRPEGAHPQRPPSERRASATSSVSQPLAAMPLQPRAPAADDLPEGWDELANAERVQHLEERFTAAVAAIEEAGQPIAVEVNAAQSALTSMRAELYGTASGRAKHRKHESRLDRALGEAVPADEGALR